MSHVARRRTGKFVVDFGEFEFPESLAVDIETAIRKAVLLKLAQYHYADNDQFLAGPHPEWHGYLARMQIADVNQFNQMNAAVPGMSVRPAGGTHA
jgi:hypothetical protein